MKNLFKKLFLIIIVSIGIYAPLSLAQNFYYDYEPSSQDNLEVGIHTKDDAVISQNGVIYKLRQAFKLTGGIYEKSEKKAIDYIKMIINIALGLVAFIAVILVIYAFYLMFFSQQDDGLTRAKKILKGVLVAVAIMGIAYFIVSFIFYLYQITTDTGETITQIESIQEKFDKGTEFTYNYKTQKP